MRGVPALIVAALVIFSAPLNAFAAERSKDQRDNPAIVFAFDGGNISQNISSVFDMFLKQKITIPIKKVTVESNKNICSTLEDFGYPPPCDVILPIISKMNPQLGGNLENVAKNTIINLPDADLSQTRVKKFIYNSDDSEAAIDRIQKTWLYSKVTRLAPQNQYTLRYELTRYELSIKLDDTRQAYDLYNQFIQSKIANTLVRLRGTGTSKVELHTLTEAVVSAACKSGVPWPDFDYSATLSSDTDAAPFLEKARALAAKNPLPVVHIVDGPLSNGPRLKGPTPQDLFASGKCSWDSTFEQKKEHANLMAGIIASKPTSGFLGVWPNVTLESFNLEADDRDLNASLMSYLESAEAPIPEVFLFASGIRFTDTESFPGKIQRFKTNEGGTLENFRNVIVASAPYSKSGDPLELDGKYALFPQVFADLASVIVVSACSPCTPGQVELLPSAAISDSDEDALKFVHVAAPGGTVYGWTGPGTVGAAEGGTSEAASYVAGMIAGMIASYPLVFTDPTVVKYRVQICSTPMNAYTDGQNNEDINKLAAGVVDLSVCLLDPAKSWVKKGNGWESFDFKGWSEIRAVDGLEDSQILRVKRMEGNRRGSVEWRVYSDRKKKKKYRGVLRNRHEPSIRQTIDANISPTLKVLACDGSEFEINDTDDIIFSYAGSRSVCE